MTRRTYKVLTLSVQFPLPPGKNQKQMLEHVKELLTNVSVKDNLSPQTIIKVLKSETVYP